MKTCIDDGVPAFDGARLLDGLRTLRGFGARGDAVCRQSLSADDMRSRRYLARRMLDAGLDARIDGVGNVIGRSRQSGPALLLGSHSDTQPVGGWLDGTLGVLAAIEVARALLRCPATAHLAVDVASFIDEEGSHLGFLGSRAAAGLLDQATLDASDSLQGGSLLPRLKAAGLSGLVEPLDLARYAGFIELHIEQGPYLDDAGQSLGVVTAIVGARTLDIVASGEMNHAGSTPMARRRDAGRAMIHLAAALDQCLEQMAGPYTVWNFGQMAFSPGATAIVPDGAMLRLQFRDQDEDLLDAVEAAMMALVQARNGRDGVRLEAVRRGEPTRAVCMDGGLREACIHAAHAVAPTAWRELPSGALHDAGILGRVMPAAMLFVPSIGGISHSAAEDTRTEHLLAGGEALLQAVIAWARINNQLADGS
ncbi:hydantoinase/carbamoylase family amidase [Craterilacuibacter sinensis]|uniref:Hydantoinase/carbamoylase family amidase n=1 Tax=Craterilacuibacter sinensis TaxID=2686017 RepID=A0A845BVF2_9NEIS|nr:hydantoinase/carbamoylase family amidase [Craterilacuibacter sinensis]MXR36493.1 hydantoinase/carbamoylase family amidase [Craterilacuibacter sinensis]